ncbi:MAG TPA: hypothetical protein VEX86_06135 [Longimicrobium sp.]|nr:hypothetical protein [Longimicrobium sp.]
MSETIDGAPPQASTPPAADRRRFLGNAAAAAAAVAGLPALLAACGEGVTEAQTGRTATGGTRASLGGGPDPGATLHKMVAGTIGSAPDVKVPALEKGGTTTYLQRVVTDSDRTGTGLATVIKAQHKFSNGTTVQVVVQDSRGKAWPARSVSKQADLAYAMKDALATNTLHYGVLRDSLNTGGPVIVISKSSVIQFGDSVASDYYGNHLDVASRGFSDVFNTSVSGIKLTATTRDITRC